LLDFSHGELFDSWLISWNPACEDARGEVRESSVSGFSFQLDVQN
jgi:hypothetical protein